MGDDLGQQRVVVRAGGIARVAEPVDPDSGAGRRLVGGEQAAARTRLAGFRHGLEIDPGLHGHSPWRTNSRLLKIEVAKRGAGGDVQLNGNQIQPGHGLGDGVFHLQTRVGLHEHEACIGLAID